MLESTQQSNICPVCLVEGGDTGEPGGTSEAEEQSSVGGEQTASTQSGTFRKVTEPPAVYLYIYIYIYIYATLVSSN